MQAAVQWWLAGNQFFAIGDVIGADATVVALVKTSLADFKPESFVASTAMPEEEKICTSAF